MIVYLHLQEQEVIEEGFFGSALRDLLGVRWQALWQSVFCMHFVCMLNSWLALLQQKCTVNPWNMLLHVE